MGKKIRVLFVFGAVANGGVERIATDLVKHFDKNLIEVSAVYHNCVDKGGISAIPSVYELWPDIDKAPYFYSLNFLSYRRWWKNFIRLHDKFDIVHLHYIDSAFCYLDLFKKTGAKTIAHAHNPLSRPISIGLIWSCIISFPVRYIADYILACSQQTAREIFGRKASSSSKCHILYNGIDVKKFSYKENLRNSLRRKYGVNDSVVIGHVGRFEKQKNHKFIIEVFKEFHRKVSDSQLWLIGTGGLFDEIKGVVEDYDLQDSVVFWGNRQDVSDLYQCMDVFIFPSLYEGLGIVLVEAQTTGLPCVTSDRIPKEADINAGLLYSLPLKEVITKWIDTIKLTLLKKRDDCSVSTVNAGFDICEISNDLQIFYINIVDMPCE